MAHIDHIINGKPAPSVTEILSLVRKPFLEIWRGRIGNKEADRISREATDLGSEVHGLIERLAKEAKLPTCGKTEKVKKLMKVFWNDFMSVYKPDFVASEVTVVNEKDHYGGTFDGILGFANGEYKGTWLVDFKVSKNDDKLRPLQLAGYYQALKLSIKDYPEHGMIVRIDPVKEIVDIETYKNLKKYVPIFLALRKVFKFLYNK